MHLRCRVCRSTAPAVQLSERAHATAPILYDVKTTTRPVEKLRRPSRRRFDSPDSTPLHYVRAGT